MSITQERDCNQKLDSCLSNAWKRYRSSKEVGIQDFINERISCYYRRQDCLNSGKKEPLTGFALIAKGLVDLSNKK